MVVTLGQGVAVAIQASSAFPVGFDDGAIDMGVGLLEPVHQCGSDVVADPFEVILQPQNATVLIEDAAVGVGGVAFPMYPMVPVVMGTGGGLLLDDLEPRIFTRGLVKMAVDADVFFILLGQCIG